MVHESLRPISLIENVHCLSLVSMTQSEALRFQITEFTDDISTRTDTLQSMAIDGVDALPQQARSFNTLTASSCQVGTSVMLPEQALLPTVAAMKLCGLSRNAPLHLCSADNMKTATSLSLFPHKRNQRTPAFRDALPYLPHMIIIICAILVTGSS